jgi:hypothetical protein
MHDAVNIDVYSNAAQTETTYVIPGPPLYGSGTGSPAPAASVHRWLQVERVYLLSYIAVIIVRPCLQAGKYIFWSSMQLGYLMC